MKTVIKNTRTIAEYKKTKSILEETTISYCLNNNRNIDEVQKVYFDSQKNIVIEFQNSSEVKIYV